MQRKKLFFLFLLLVICASGCGKKDVSDSTDSISQKSETQNEETDMTEQGEEDEKDEFPTIDVSFSLLGTDFNDYALKNNMKFIDLTSNYEYVHSAGLDLLENDILYADLAKTDYEGYVVNDGIIRGFWHDGG